MAWRWYRLGVIVVAFSVCFIQVDCLYINTTGPLPSDNEICETPDCVNTAAEMMERMNLSADSCQDFNEFACGRFNKESVIPDGKSQVSTFSVLDDAISNILKDIITEDSTPTQPRYLSNIKRFYRSCLDEDHIETVGLAPFFNTTFADDWPTLNPGWNENSFDLNEVLARYSAVAVEPIFKIYVTIDMSDSTKNTIYLLDGVLGMGQEYYSRPRNDSVIRAYERYLANTAVALNVSREVAEKDAKEVVDLEIEIAKIMVPRAIKRDVRKLYNQVQLNQLSSLYPKLDIARALRAAFEMANISLADNERIINLYPTYMGNLSSVLQRFSSRTVQNLFGFKYALSRLDRLTRRLRQIRLDFDKAYTGAKTEVVRWKACVENTAKIFPKGLSKEFVARKFSQTAKRQVNEMIDNLKQEFQKMIEEATWMSSSTKEGALAKLAAMKRKIGFPDMGFEEADIEQLYEKFIMRDDDYYNNREIGTMFTRRQLLAQLRNPISQNNWDLPPHSVNAFYSWMTNEIVFLAGILQKPFFSEAAPDYINYGAIGSVIGHEITHGYDDQGSQYDANGILRDWWTTTDRENFVNRSQCIVDQDSNVHIDEINMNLNGINTQGETVADRGGMKESFRAYKKHILKSGEQPRLPGLNLSQDQLFFLALAQLYCEKMTPERLVIHVTTNMHPPGKYRILGTMQNSEEFAKAYNCPRGSLMNPEEKCSLW